MSLPSETLDLSDLAPAASFRLSILKPGTSTPTGWAIELAGPSHPQTVAIAAEINRENLAKEQAVEFAQVNGRKWKTEAETVDERRRKNVTRVCRRIIGWSPDPTFKFVSPDPIAFSLPAAVDLFLRPELGSFFVQVTDYLTGERAFMPPSEPI
jgi:hypothetical protein